MEEIEINNENEVPKRPIFLTVLCILTFISGGMGSITALFTPLFSDMMIDFVKVNPSFDETAKTEVIMLLQAGWVYYLITFALALCSLTGAILMWQLKKIGFHLYALSNLGLLFVPMLMLGMATSWGSILLTSSFIALYATNFKYMK